LTPSHFSHADVGADDNVLRHPAAAWPPGETPRIQDPLLTRADAVTSTRPSCHRNALSPDSLSRTHENHLGKVSSVWPCIVEMARDRQRRLEKRSVGESEGLPLAMARGNEPTAEDSSGPATDAGVEVSGGRQPETVPRELGTISLDRPCDECGSLRSRSVGSRVFHADNLASGLLSELGDHPRQHGGIHVVLQNCYCEGEVNVVIIDRQALSVGFLQLNSDTSLVQGLGGEGKH